MLGLSTGASVPEGGGTPQSRDTEFDQMGFYSQPAEVTGQPQLRYADLLSPYHLIKGSPCMAQVMWGRLTHPTRLRARPAQVSSMQ